MKKKYSYLLILFPFLIFSQGSGNSLNFNGSTQYVSVPVLSPTIGNSDFTVECFAKFTSFANHGGVITAFDSNNGGWAIHQEPDGTVTFLIGNDAGGDLEAIGSGILSTGVWYHIVAVKRGGDIEFYINGELQGTKASNRTIPYYVTHIGTRYINYSTWRHNGQLDEIRIWNTALTQTDIRNYMTKKITSSHPNYANLVAYYNADTGSGTTLIDQSSNTNNGTLVNSPTWQTSAAPIGNDITFLTNVSNGSTLNLSHSDGSNFKVNITGGTADVIFIYNVDEEPNVTTPPAGLDQLSQYNYWGVRAFGSSSLVYEVVYNYDGHSGISDEDNLRLCSRDNNSSLSWAEESATLDTGANTLTLGGQTGTEFILGSVGGNTLPVEEFELLDISIYPNPTESVLKLSEVEFEDEFYQIYDVNGRIIKEGNLSTSKEISVESLKQGMYFLKLDNTKMFRFLKH